MPRQPTKIISSTKNYEQFLAKQIAAELRDAMEIVAEDVILSPKIVRTVR